LFLNLRQFTIICRLRYHYWCRLDCGTQLLMESVSGPFVSLIVLKLVDWIFAFYVQ